MRLSVVAALVACLASIHPAGASDATARAENVIIVTLDGLRHQEFFSGADPTLLDLKTGGVSDVDSLRKDFWRDSGKARRETLLPFMWGTLARGGQVFGDRSRRASCRVTNGLKFSYPGYSEMFCGFGDPRIDSNDKKVNPNGSVLEFLNGRAPFQGRVAAFCSWDVASWIFRAEQNDLKVQAAWNPITDEPLSDRQRMVNRMLERLPHYWADNAFDMITEESAEHLVRHKPRVLYIALGETDEWAHERRYDLYLHAAHQSDRFLAELWRTVQHMPEYRDKTALLLTTDHGRGSTPANWIDHDRDVEDAEFIWIAVMGPGTPALGVREAVETTQSQVAATIAALLGEDFVAHSPKSAKPLPGVCQPRTAAPSR